MNIYVYIYILYILPQGYALIYLAGISRSRCLLTESKCVTKANKLAQLHHYAAATVAIPKRILRDGFSPWLKAGKELQAKINPQTANVACSLVIL